MAYFVICGKPDCPAFVHAIHVARYLEVTLPHFNVHIIQRKTGQWEPWLADINFQNRWHHTYSPIIWKELSMRGGVAHYVGGLSEFWEYCYDYYGLESLISSEDLQKMVADNLQFFSEMEQSEEEKQKNIRRISIFGITPMLPVLLTELLQIPDLHKSSGLTVKLYDINLDIIETAEFVYDMINDLETLSTNGELQVFTVVEDMQDALTDCELLIVLGDYSKRNGETESDWLARNTSSMFMLADEVNVFAKRDLRIILAIDGPICFNSNVLMDTCTSIRIQNIVAVTADVGLGPLKYAAEQARIQLKELGAPPVWGYVGINHFVDINSIIMYSDVYRPYQRVIKNKGGSTLPLGIIESELRCLAYLIDDVEDVWLKATNTRHIVKQQLERPPILSKCRALVSLVKLWYAKEPSEDIISLGVCSNGSHGLPAGLVFSQPVILNRNIWTPLKNFPVTEKSSHEIAQLVPEALEITRKRSIGPNSIGSVSYPSSFLM